MSDPQLWMRVFRLRERYLLRQAESDRLAGLSHMTYHAPLDEGISRLKHPFPASHALSSPDEPAELASAGSSHNT
jgi:hypothetical protein